MKAPLIASKSKFAEILQASVANAKQLVAANPDDSFLKSILAQLEFMGRCIAENRAPSPAELERINVGVIAVRTLEDTSPQYASQLSELEYAFRRWKDLPK